MPQGSTKESCASGSMYIAKSPQSTEPIRLHVHVDRLDEFLSRYAPLQEENSD